MTVSMKNFTASPTAKNKIYFALAGVLVFLLAVISLFTGKYPFSLPAILSGDKQELRTFLMLRVSRTVTALFGGFVLGAAGFVYQTVFRNPLASPDIIGVSSGASAGAAAGILLLGGSVFVTGFSFIGAVSAVLLALLIASIDKSGRKSTIVLAGIAVHALAQAVLMALKLLADPEKELARIEFWIMGSLSGVRMTDIGWNLILCAACMLALFLLHRQTLLLSADEGEAQMLGVPVQKLRLWILLIATLSVASVVSLTGLISFVGLLAPHVARLLTRDNRPRTMFLSGLLGSAILTGADILARSISSVELPVSIFTSLLGAPLLVILAIRKGGE